MSGATNSDTAEERLNNVTSKLDDYVRAKGLPDVPLTEDADFFLSLTREQLTKLAPIECSEGAFLLKQRAFYWQKEINRESAKIGWAEAMIRNSIADYVSKTPGYSYEERRALAVKPANNEYAFKLETIKIRSQAKVERFKYLCNQAMELAKSLEKLSYSKAGKYVSE